MSKFYNKIDFIGEIFIPEDEDKFVEIKDNEKGWLGHRLNFGIRENKYNSVFLELYGGYMNAGGKNVVYTFSQGTKDKKGSKIEVPWESRLEESTLELVADFKKIIVDLETDFEKKTKYMKIAYEIRNLKYEGVSSEKEKEEMAKLEKEYKELATNRHEFISEYDAILFLKANLGEFKEHKFRIQGVPVLNEWKGKYYKKYQPETIEIVPQDYKNQLKMSTDIFFFANSIDESSMKDGKIYVDGYMQDYVRNSKRDEFFPQSFVINTGKLDMENENHVKLLGFMKGQFNVKGRNLYHLPWEVNIYRGAEVLDAKGAITPEQQAMINVGLAKAEDFNTGAFGENIEEFRLAKPLLVDKFKSGALDTGFKESEALDLVCVTTEDVKLEDVIVKKENSPTEDVSNSSVSEETIADTIDNLFG